MTLFLAGLALIVASGLSTLVAPPRRRDAAYLSLLISGCVLSAAAAIRVLAGGAEVAATLVGAMPGGAWSVGIDALSAVFLLATLVVGGACAVFGVYDRPVDARASHAAHRASPCFVSLLIASLALVATARNVVTFLCAWEIMAITSYVVIVTHRESRAVRRAGFTYLAATHAATLLLFAMFGTWQLHAANGGFDALAAAAPALSSGTTRAILLLALGGFGVKAGFVPLHFWLPPAHASAPADISALMSGVVIKAGIYGIIRVLLLLGGAPAWWGWLVLALGVVSGVLGVLWALAQHDTKRLLAYHSVENIGIILMGVGVGALGLAYRLPLVAVLGFAGALLHTVNHALFKSLLFLGIGAVYRATGTRNMEELGGVARAMPRTWILFLVGAAAIIGVPPLNGFVSEWLVYQGLFHTGLSGGTVRLAVFGIPALALIGALALACFAKVAGVAFLGTARSDRVAHAREPGRGVRLPMTILAAGCVIIGLGPALGLGIVGKAAARLASAAVPAGTAGTAAISLPAEVVAGAWTIAYVAAALLLVAIVLWWLRDARARRNGIAPRGEPTWGCGFDEATPRMQYTASSFATPLVSLFGEVSSVRVERAPAALHTHPVDPVLDGVVRPAWRAVRDAALRMRGLQQGRLHWYLLYVVAALLALLAYLSLGPRA